MKTLLFFALIALSFSTQAQQGAYVGALAASTELVDCAHCSAEGSAGVDFGFDVNSVVGLNAKIGFADDFTHAFAGADLGSSFGTGIFRLYGKVGIALLSEEVPGSREHDSAGSLALGLGLRFTPMGDQKGLYITLESIGSEFYGNALGTTALAVGYKF
ncbi:outer membrane beta-barrel protein [Marinimicrobium sp. ABcell2]|uniref:outer membrane beta-barrel protein n=1 Tax=Marinimicrobium sp. ABcell2 TaxID=3069751 RepID=UPI0027AE2826|nr:outer membrane beta-barrel protein [Marinimicrobium sp. ABcell2]MDQ2078353.1 outer membrane beta-barrel protein [Marinimicrobium sp. ABcell2]